MAKSSGIVEGRPQRHQKLLMLHQLFQNLEGKMSNVEAGGGTCLSLLPFESTAFMAKVGQTRFAKHLR